MANVTFTRPAPFGSIAIFHAVDSLQSAAAAIYAWNTSRKTRAVLRNLSDDMLNDIGLDRGALERL